MTVIFHFCLCRYFRALKINLNFQTAYELVVSVGIKLMFSLNLHNRFFSFSADQIPRYITLSVLNCKLVENIVHIYCSGQSLHFITVNILKIERS